MSHENDRALRFYHEVLGLEYLHYGLWNADDEVTIENLKQAQERYVDYLLENLPKAATSVLDSGCGTGELSTRFKAMGLDVEGLSPDITQKKVFAEKLDAPFHHCRFENLTTDKRYDCIVMSESAQYVPYQQLFSNARRHLNPDGYLMICDYFVLDNASGEFAKSGHNLGKFMAESKAQNFNLIKEEDLTDRVTKTLDFGRMFIDKIILSLDIATEKFRSRHPYVTKLFNKVFNKKIKRMQQQAQVLDTEKFKQNKRYIFLLFKLG